MNGGKTGSAFKYFHATETDFILLFSKGHNIAGKEIFFMQDGRCDALGS